MRFTILLITIFVLECLSRDDLFSKGSGKGIYKPHDPDECELGCTDSVRRCIQEESENCYYTSAEEYWCFSDRNCPKDWVCEKDDDDESGYCARKESLFLWICMCCCYCLIFPGIVLGFIMYKVKEDDKRRKEKFVQLNPTKLTPL